MRWILTVLLTAFTLWSAAFAVFLGSMYVPAADRSIPADALIVLTGGASRVDHGLQLLADGAAPVLFISGVGEKVTLAEMLAAHTTPDIKNKILHRSPEIVFDYNASTTQTNASQAAQFVRLRGFHSIRLITAQYHMPRSLVEFHAALPGVVILREPVVPESFAGMSWWNDPVSRRLVLQEFHKYLAASVRTLFDHDD